MTTKGLEAYIEREESQPPKIELPREQGQDTAKIAHVEEVELRKDIELQKAITSATSLPIELPDGRSINYDAKLYTITLGEKSFQVAGLNGTPISRSMLNMLSPSFTITDNNIVISAKSERLGVIPLGDFGSLIVDLDRKGEATITALGKTLHFTSTET